MRLDHAPMVGAMGAEGFGIIAISFAVLNSNGVLGPDTKSVTISDSAERRRLDTRLTLQTESFDDKRQRFSTRLARVSHHPTSNTVADYEGRPPGPDSLLFGSRPDSFHNWQSNTPNHFSPEVDRVPGRPPENV